jgi:hypothetical protein
MFDTPPLPAVPRVRQRRRWIGASLVAAIAAAMAWSVHFRGTIDPRLVGEWKNVVPDGLPAEVSFNSDGGCSWVVAYISVPVSSFHRWAVRGDEILVINPTSFTFHPSLKGLMRDGELLWNRLTTGGVTERLRILELTDDTLRLERNGPLHGEFENIVETYRRKPPVQEGTKR